jgi:hypothetical protein
MTWMTVVIMLIVAELHVQQVVNPSVENDRNSATGNDMFECNCSSISQQSQVDTQLSSSVRFVNDDAAAQSSDLGMMQTLRVFVVARSSYRLHQPSHSVEDGGSAPAVSSASDTSSDVLSLVCDGLMHKLQPLTALLVEIIPLRLPVAVMDERCFLRQASRPAPFVFKF